MLNSNYWKTAIIVSRIYHAVLWATRPTLNFMNNKMAARKRASRGQNGNKQNKYFKQRYLTQIELLERWASLHLSLYISHHCIFQKQFFCNPLIKHFCYFQVILLTETFFSRTMSDVRLLFRPLLLFILAIVAHMRVLFSEKKNVLDFFLCFCAFLPFFFPFLPLFSVILAFSKKVLHLMS